ncbi:MAG: ROK family protein [Ignavibacteria bacterium]|nr:ROK family protein [Ignavibacteria bacterium]MBT8382829.1 ROK family protein [Ignavibacteria bacterium]MBT8392227.1 ROK family protein [Ignavibacteria bacterium]NNJ53478.1 ROK family protein [Ignavibacteriaceae bacterium]NNL21726.1 ROK family protein [Ignavibacteriaceae bacterium]
MDKNSKHAIGIDLGGTSIKLGIVSDTGRIHKKTKLRTEADKGPKQVIENIKTGIKELTNNSKYKIEGIGIGCPGVVTPRKGIVENPPNLPGWKKVNVARIIYHEFEKEVYVDNDANAAAIGELTFGSGKKYKSFIMITLGTGVGGGIVMDKKIYHGDFGAAGEIGHISINYRGPKCNCGSFGCIEAYAGNQYLRERVRRQLKNHPGSKLWKLIDKDLNKVSPRNIQTAAEFGDKFGKRVIEDLGLQLGSAFTSLVNVLDISVFIIGGGLAGFGKPLFGSIEETLRARVMAPIRPRVKVLPAKLKNDAGIKGASALVFHHT